MIAKTTCTGCGSCSAVCPKHCIQMEPNRLGQLTPKVDEAKCVHCGKCSATCPQNHIPEQREPLTCYAAWSRCEDDYIYSASGGIAASFARYQLAHDGAVYGCDYDANADLRHFRLHDEADVRKMQSSKYSQSIVYDCFEEIKRLLQRDTSVVFIGTPCQVAGLLHFLNRGYPTLITIDLICHGAPPNSYLKQHLTECKLHAPYEKIRFRGEYDQMLTVWKDNTIVYQKDRTEDPYFASFYQNMISYDSCFACQYAQSRRISDITIGDFWGLGELKKIKPKSQRPSIILVNTEKGKHFFDMASGHLIYEQRDVAEGVRGNGRLMHAPGKNKGAKGFQALYRLKIFGFRNSVRPVLWLEKFRNACVRFFARLAELKAVFIRKITNIAKGKTKQ